MSNDPAYRFTVVYKDGREMSQEDDRGVVVRDHCHIGDYDQIEIYSLKNRPGDHVISVNFTDGTFSINGNIINIFLDDMDMYMNPFHSDAIFKPILGRRNFVGESGHKVFFFCGFETTIKNKKHKRIIYVSEHGEVYFEA